MTMTMTRHSSLVRKSPVFLALKDNSVLVELYIVWDCHLIILYCNSDADKKKQKKNCLSSLSLSPQLLPEHIHHGVDEWELQHIPSVRADILLHRPGRDLPALPGPDLCGDWVRFLCACGFMLFKLRYSLAASTEWMILE